MATRALPKSNFFFRGENPKMTRHFSARTIKVITIPISVIVMLTILYSFWDSLDRLKVVNWVLGWTLAIAAVAAFVVSNRVEKLEDDEDTAKQTASDKAIADANKEAAKANEAAGVANKTAGEANERAASLEKEAAKANERAAALEKEAAQARLALEEVRANASAAQIGVKGLEHERIGLLSQEAWNKIAAAPAPSILGGGFALVSSNPNARQLAAQLHAALSKADWRLLQTQFNIPITGVVVLVNSTHSQESKDHGEAMFKNLKDAGVDVELIWKDETPMNLPYWVLVGTPRGLPVAPMPQPGPIVLKETLILGPTPPKTEDKTQEEKKE
jgi:hypothetical protein